VEKVEDLQGIVLIDELEAHLHPKWQREFPTLLKTYLPKVQFIVSTHSPMIVLGMPENTCYFHVQKDQEGNIQAEKVEIDVKNMLAGQILTSPLFGLETVRHIDNQVDYRLTSLENAEKKADTPELQKGIQQLKDRLKNLKNNEKNQ
jgi:predicted ATP-binding protein involved in virulence